MLLTVDVGNSHTVAGVFDGKHLVCEWRLKSDRDRTSDELAIRYHGLFQLADISPSRINGFVLASVVPALEGVWLSYAAKYLRSLENAPLTINHDTPTGFTIGTDNPAEVGADRIVNAVAAWHRFQSDLIVIDFGTAITFDCVSIDKKYLGGAIVPGIGISLDALAGRTAKLPLIDINTPPPKVIGTNTVDAIRSGILRGYGGLVDRMVEELTPEITRPGHEVAVIGTGGMAKLLAPFSQKMNEVDQLLTLKGLQLIFNGCRS
jgi:type III pantothenate kinase